MKPVKICPIMSMRESVIEIKCKKEQCQLWVEYSQEEIIHYKALGHCGLQGGVK